MEFTDQLFPPAYRDDSQYGRIYVEEVGSMVFKSLRKQDVIYNNASIQTGGSAIYPQLTSTQWTLSTIVTGTISNCHSYLDFWFTGPAIGIVLNINNKTPTMDFPNIFPLGCFIDGTAYDIKASDCSPWNNGFWDNGLGASSQYRAIIARDLPELPNGGAHHCIIVTPADRNRIIQNRIIINGLLLSAKAGYTPDPQLAFVKSYSLTAASTGQKSFITGNLIPLGISEITFTCTTSGTSGNAYLYFGTLSNSAFPNRIIPLTQAGASQSIKFNPPICYGSYTYSLDNPNGVIVDVAGVF